MVIVMYATAASSMAGWASSMGYHASEKDLGAMASAHTDQWVEILPRTPLRAGYEDTRYSYFDIPSQESWTYLRVNMYPGKWQCASITASE